MHTKSKMRAPNSPHALKKNSFSSPPVQTTSSSGARTSDEDFSDGASSESYSPKPPTARPHYTSRYKDGKQIVGVEASLGGCSADSPNLNNNNNNIPNLTIDGVSLQKTSSAEIKSNLLGGYHRSRERTRRSAVLKLLERKQKAQEKEKEKEKERDRSNRARSHDSLRAKQQQFDFIRDRSWARVDSSKKKNAAFKSFTDVEENGEEEDERDKEELILQDKLNQFRFSRSVSGQYRSSRSCERADVTTKTYISIGPGKPTRIREHSPAKAPASPPVQSAAIAAAAAARTGERQQQQHHHQQQQQQQQQQKQNSVPEKKTEEDCPPIPPERRRRSESPLKNFHNTNNLNHRSRDTSPSKSADILQQKSAPLKSTGLLRDIPINISNVNYYKHNNSSTKNSSTDSSNNSGSTQHFTTRTTTTTNTTFKFPGFAPNQRKRSFTTQKTIHISNGYPQPTPRNRRVSDLGPRLPPMDIESSSSGTSSYHSSPSSSARSSEERDFSYRPNSSCSSSFSSSSLSGSTDSVDSTKTNDSGLSKRRASLEKRFQERSSRIPSPERKTSVHINPAAETSPPLDDEENNSEGSSSGFSSASSRLLYNLSSGYRYYRAQASNAPSAKTSYQQRRFSHDHTNEKFREQLNQRYSPPSSSSSSSSAAAAPPSSSSTSSGVNKGSSRSPPLRKISLPPTCYEDPERSLQSARRWEQFHAIMEKGGGKYTTPGGSYTYSKYKLCDDSLHYPGCCPEHDKIFLPPSSSISISSSSPSNASFRSPLEQQRANRLNNNNLNQLSSYKSKLKSGDSGLGSSLLQGHQNNYGMNATPPPPLRDVCHVGRRRRDVDLVSPDSDNFSVASSSCCSVSSNLKDNDGSRINELRHDFSFDTQHSKKQQELSLIHI